VASTSMFNKKSYRSKATNGLFASHLPGLTFLLDVLFDRLYSAPLFDLRKNDISIYMKKHPNTSHPGGLAAFWLSCSTVIPQLPPCLRDTRKTNKDEESSHVSQGHKSGSHPRSFISRSYLAFTST